MLGEQVGGAGKEDGERQRGRSIVREGERKTEWEAERKTVGGRGREEEKVGEKGEKRGGEGEREGGERERGEREGERGR